MNRRRFLNLLGGIPFLGFLNSSPPPLVTGLNAKVYEKCAVKAQLVDYGFQDMGAVQMAKITESLQTETIKVWDSWCRDTYDRLNATGEADENTIIDPNELAADEYRRRVYQSGMG